MYGLTDQLLHLLLPVCLTDWLTGSHWSVVSHNSPKVCILPKIRENSRLQIAVSCNIEPLQTGQFDSHELMADLCGLQHSPLTTDNLFT